MKAYPITGLTPVLRALGYRPSLTKLVLRCCPLGRVKLRLLRLALCNTPSLQSLVLRRGTLVDTGFAELAPALYHNTSIKVLDMSSNRFNDTAASASEHYSQEQNRLVSSPQR
jgi:hypothetical protein